MSSGSDNPSGKSKSVLAVERALQANQALLTPKAGGAPLARAPMARAVAPPTAMPLLPPPPRKQIISNPGAAAALVGPVATTAAVSTSTPTLTSAVAHAPVRKVHPAPFDEEMLWRGNTLLKLNFSKAMAPEQRMFRLLRAPELAAMVNWQFLDAVPEKFRGPAAGGGGVGSAASSSSHSNWVSPSSSELFLAWWNPRASRLDPRVMFLKRCAVRVVPLSAVEDVLPGGVSSVFARYRGVAKQSTPIASSGGGGGSTPLAPSTPSSSPLSPAEDTCFSIVLAGRTIDCICSTPEECSTWVAGLLRSRQESRLASGGVDAVQAALGAATDALLAEGPSPLSATEPSGGGSSSASSSSTASRPGQAANSSTSTGATSKAAAGPVVVGLSERVAAPTAKQQQQQQQHAQTVPHVMGRDRLEKWYRDTMFAAISGRRVEDVATALAGSADGDDGGGAYYYVIVIINNNIIMYWALAGSADGYNGGGLRSQSSKRGSCAYDATRRKRRRCICV